MLVAEHERLCVGLHEGSQKEVCEELRLRPGADVSTVHNGGADGVKYWRDRSSVPNRGGGLDSHLLGDPPERAQAEAATQEDDRAPEDVVPDRERHDGLADREVHDEGGDDGE